MTGVGEACGGGGSGPVGGGCKGPFVADNAALAAKEAVGEFSALLELLLWKRKPGSSGRGGKLLDGGGFGDVKDNLSALCATELRKEVFVGRASDSGFGTSELGGGGGAKLGAGRGGGGGIDRL